MSTSTDFGQIPDQDLAGIALGEDDSDYDDLDSELTATVHAGALIEVLGRPGYAVRCRTDYTSRDIESLRKKCRDKNFADGVDGVKYAALLLALTCIAIVRNGKDLVLDGESPVTFTSKALQGRYRTTDAAATVKAFYGLEGHVDSAGRRLMTEAGWGDDTYTVDPTQ